MTIEIDAHVSTKVLRMMGDIFFWHLAYNTFLHSVASFRKKNDIEQ